jgi:short-subunit dehydrogenase
LYNQNHRFVVNTGLEIPFRVDMEMTNDNSPVVIITGASAGIGRALALKLAGERSRVVLAARRAERLELLANECIQLGGQALAVPTDVADEIQCKNLVERTVQKFGRLDMLINNAGLAVGSQFEELPDLALFKHVMDVNFYGAVYCTYHAIPYLKQTQGRIVAVSSLGGKMPIPYNTSYIASKYAMHGFYDSLRMELVKHNVSVSVICPYWVITEFHEDQLDKTGTPRGSRGRLLYSKKMMTAGRCADIILRAARQRKREVLMGPGRVGVWLKLIAPRFLDWVTIKLFLESAARRVHTNQMEQEP